jgi:hypothetical protein
VTRSASRGTISRDADGVARKRRARKRRRRAKSSASQILSRPPPGRGRTREHALGDEFEARVAIEAGQIDDVVDRVSAVESELVVSVMSPGQAEGLLERHGRLLGSSWGSGCRRGRLWCRGARRFLSRTDGRVYGRSAQSRGACGETVVSDHVAPAAARAVQNLRFAVAFDAPKHGGGAESPRGGENRVSWPPFGRLYVEE